MQQPGLPDRLILTKKGWVTVEFKGERTAVTAVQRAIHRRILQYGPYVAVARAPGTLTVGDTVVGEFKTGQELLQLLLDNCFGGSSR